MVEVSLVLGGPVLNDSAGGLRRFMTATQKPTEQWKVFGIVQKRV